MLTNPDTLTDIRLTLTLVVVAALLFLAQLGNDDDPPFAGAPAMVAEVAPIQEQTYEIIQYELFPEQKEVVNE